MISVEEFDCAKNDNDALDIVKRHLLENPDGINASDAKDGLTYAHLAAFAGFFNSLEYLVTNGANINITSKDGDTPLHLACLTKKMDCIRLLLKHGAKTLVRNKSGNFSFDIARHAGFDLYELKNSIKK